MKTLILILFLSASVTAHAKLEFKKGTPSKARVVSSDEKNYTVEFQDKSKKKIPKNVFDHMKVTPGAEVYIYKDEGEVLK